MLVLKNVSGQNPHIKVKLPNPDSKAFMGRIPDNPMCSKENRDQLIELPNNLSADKQSPVSRLHCMIEKRGKVFYLTNKSKHGTFVNGKRLAVNQSRELCPDDKVCLQRSPIHNEQAKALMGSHWEYTCVFSDVSFAPESKRIIYFLDFPEDASHDEENVESFKASMQIVEETTKTKTSVDNNIKLTSMRRNRDLQEQFKANKKSAVSGMDIFDAMMTEPSCRQQQAQLDQAPPCEACTQAHRDFHNKRQEILGPSARKSQRVIKCSDCKSRSQEFFHMCHALQGSRDENKKLKRQLEESQKALQAALESQFNESQDAFQALKHQRT